MGGQAGGRALSYHKRHQTHKEFLILVVWLKVNGSDEEGFGGNHGLTGLFLLSRKKDVIGSISGWKS